MKRILKNLIKAYRYFISPLLFPACRFHPTCSAYALEAVEEHGAARGVFLSVKRILRCNPFGRGGFDPVPKNEACGGAIKIHVKKEVL